MAVNRSGYLRALAVTLLALLLFAVPTTTPVHAATLTVNTNADGASVNDAFCTLREATMEANRTGADPVVEDACGSPNLSGADTIVFAANYTITLAPTEGPVPIVTSNITIDGNGPSNTIIQANAVPNTATYRVMAVGATGMLTVMDVTARHGSLTNGNGAGILNNAGGILTINNSAIIANSVVNGFGGGIYNGGTTTIDASTVSSNSSTRGGGIYDTGTLNVQNGSTIGGTGTGNTANGGGGIYTDEGTVTITDSRVINNASIGTSFGGGIFNNNANVTIDNSTLSANTAVDGAAIYVASGGDLTVRNHSTIGGTGVGDANTASGNGGGIHSGGTVTITDTRFLNNSAAQGGAYYRDSGSATVHESCISGNSGNGTTTFAVFATSPTQDFENDWWGAADGPGPVGPGSGDTVSTNIDFTPFLTSPILGCQDADEDGVVDAEDLCPSTAPGADVDANGCSDPQRDDDDDGVPNGEDQCPNSPTGVHVDSNGCALAQLDTDNDGVADEDDECPDTPVGVDVDEFGCPITDEPTPETGRPNVGGAIAAILRPRATPTRQAAAPTGTLAAPRTGDGGLASDD